jgi:hypothetical protein
LEAIAVRAAELIAERCERSPWMDRHEAAAYLGCSVSSFEKCIAACGALLMGGDGLEPPTPCL